MKHIILRKGFTLIELLTVIAIIALLASIILASLNTARQRSRDSKRISDIKSIELALSLYYNDNSCYPNDIYGSATNKCNGAALAIQLSPTYLPTMPTDPSDNSHYKYAAVGSNATCSGFHLGATLEQSSNSALNADADYYYAGYAGTATYGTRDAAVCTGSPTNFAGIDPSTGIDTVYDVHS